MEYAEILSIAAPTGILSAGAAGLLFRYFMDIQVKKVVGKYEAELRDKTEVLKTNLSIHAHETTIGLTRLEELRATSIQEIYVLIIAWQELFLEITQPNIPARGSDQFMLQQLVNWSQNLVRESEKLSIKVRDKALFFDEQSYQVIATFGKLTMELARTSMTPHSVRGTRQRTRTIPSCSSRSTRSVPSCGTRPRVSMTRHKGPL